MAMAGRSAGSGAMESPQITGAAPRLPWAVYGYAFVASLASFVYGYNTGIIAPAIIFLRKSLTPPPTIGETSAIVSIILLGAMAGSLVSGAAADRYGRVPLIIWNNIVMLVAAVCAAFAQSPAAVFASRLVLGLGVGVASVVPALYIAEMAPAHVRGRLGALNQLLGWTGVVAAYFAGYEIVRCSVGETLCWRYMFSSGAVLCVFHMILASAVLPETPRHLVARGRTAEAVYVLVDIYGRGHDDHVMRQFQLVSERKDYREPALLRPKDFKRKRHGKDLWRVVVLQLVQQVSGNSAILYYTTIVLHSLGFSARDALFYNALASLPQLVVIASLFVIVDKSGRRPPLLASQAGVVIALCLIGLATMTNDTHARFWMLLTGIVLHRGAFAFGLGPIPGMMTPELLPFAVRSRGISFASATNWLANFVVTASFPLLFEHFVPAHVYWAFAALSLAAMVWVATSLPETRGVCMHSSTPDAPMGSPRAANSIDIWSPEREDLFDLR